MFARIYATHNRRVILTLVGVLLILSILGYLVMSIREATIARLPLNPNQPNDLIPVTAPNALDVLVTLESSIANIPAAASMYLPVKIMVSKPADIILSDLAVELKYDTDKYTFDRFDETDTTCNVMSLTTPTPTATLTPAPAVAATGGTVTDVGGFRIHTFTTSETFTVTQPGNVEVLVVAGGGGGGNGTTAATEAGGGGAGGLVYHAAKNVPLGTYPVTVGAGGAGGANGSDSIFSDIIANGGGAGGGDYSDPGNPGGSGGGGGHSWTLGGPATQGNSGGGTGYGSAGGKPNMVSKGAGGGGAGGIGGEDGTGGAGKPYNISGASVGYAGGGGGAKWSPSMSASDGGGAGGNDQSLPNAGTANTGGGGGGAYGTTTAGAAGGSGVVIIRYPHTTVLGAHTGDQAGLTLVGAGVLDANASSQTVTAAQKTIGDTQPGLTNFCLAKVILKLKTDGFTTSAPTGRVQVFAMSVGTNPFSGTNINVVDGQDFVEVTKADPNYTVASPAYEVRMIGTVALTIKKPDGQIKRGDDFYIDIMAKPTVPSGTFIGMSALEFDFGYGAVIGADGVPSSKIFITKFDTSQSTGCSILEHVLPSVTDGYNVASQRPYITYSKAGHTQFPNAEFCVGRIYMKAMETGLVTMSIKTTEAVALDAKGRQMPILNTNGVAQSVTLDVVPSTEVDPSCEDLTLNVDTGNQKTYVRPQQAVIISMNTGLAYKILADKGTGITLKNPPKRFTYTAPATEGKDRIQIWRTDNTYCEPEINIQTNESGASDFLDGVYIDPNKVSIRMKIRPQGVIKGRLPYTKLKVAIATGGLPTNNNLIDPVSNEFVSIGDGMFEGIVTFDPRYIKPGNGYKLIIKGSKHLAKRICEPEPNKSKTKPDNAYVCPKDNAGIFAFKNGLNGPYDFTKVYLPAGDLFISRQDGVIDSTDLTYIRKNLGSQDPELLRIGDLNMDGQIDTQDYLITMSNVVNNIDED